MNQEPTTQLSDEQIDAEAKRHWHSAPYSGRDGQDFNHSAFARAIEAALATSRAPAGASPVTELVITDRLRNVFQGGRPLAYSLEDYWLAPGEGPLHATWQDKPHRVVYDLVAALVHAATSRAPAATVSPAAAPAPTEQRLAILVNELVEQGQFFKRGEIDEAQFIRAVNHYVDSLAGEAATQPALSDEQWNKVVQRAALCDVDIERSGVWTFDEKGLRDFVTMLGYVQEREAATQPVPLHTKE